MSVREEKFKKISDEAKFILHLEGDIVKHHQVSMGVGKNVLVYKTDDFTIKEHIFRDKNYFEIDKNINKNPVYCERDGERYRVHGEISHIEDAINKVFEKLTLREKLIPFLDRMIIKEKEHLDFLNGYSGEFVDQCKVRSIDMLKHYGERREEYIEYFS